MAVCGGFTAKGMALLFLTNICKNICNKKIYIYVYIWEHAMGLGNQKKEVKIYLKNKL